MLFSDSLITDKNTDKRFWFIINQFHKHSIFFFQKNKKILTNINLVCKRTCFSFALMCSLFV